MESNQNTNQPTENNTASYGPAVVVSGDSDDTSGASSSPVKKRRNWKLFALIAVCLLIVFGGGASAAYFGYYQNPSTIYSQSLKNTGKGYDKLVNYADSHSTSANKAYTGTGTYSFDGDSFKTDGSLSFKGDDKNAAVSFDVGLATSRPKVEALFIDSPSDTPDIYLRASSIKGLGGSLGAPQYDQYLNGLDNQWVAIDHTLLDNLAKSQADTGTSATQPPTKDQIIDEAHAFGSVNQQYLFTADSNKAVLKRVKNIGKETVDGHQTYHYKVSIDKDHAKAYFKAQQDALLASKLGGWIRQNKYEDAVTKAGQSLQDSTQDIKANETYDIWMDTSHHIVYKFRVPDTKNPTTNYVDVGLDYKKGDQLPLFISGQAKEDGDTVTGKLAATFDMKTMKTDVNLSLNGTGSQAGTLKADFSFGPTNQKISVAKPATSKPLSEVLNSLGIDPSMLMSGGSGSSSQSGDELDTL